MFDYKVDLHPKIIAMSGAGQFCSCSGNFPTGLFSISNGGNSYTAKIFGTAFYTVCQPDDEGTLNIGGTQVYAYSGCSCNGQSQVGSGCGGGSCTSGSASINPDGSVSASALNDCLAHSAVPQTWGFIDATADATATGCLPGYNPVGSGVCAPSGPTPVCGDGAVNTPGEQCDIQDLAGKSCTDFIDATTGKLFTGGTLGCYPPGSPNECKFDTSGCVSAGSACTNPAYPDSCSLSCVNLQTDTTIPALNCGSCGNKCDSPPANQCVPPGSTTGTTTLRVYNSGGYCQSGSCVYPYTDTYCPPAGCVVTTSNPLAHCTSCPDLCTYTGQYFCDTSTAYKICTLHNCPGNDDPRSDWTVTSCPQGQTCQSCTDFATSSCIGGRVSGVKCAPPPQKKICNIDADCTDPTFPKCCGNLCIPTSDLNNCGQCGNICQDIQVCQPPSPGLTAQCVCPQGTTWDSSQLICVSTCQNGACAPDGTVILAGCSNNCQAKTCVNGCWSSCVFTPIGQCAPVCASGATSACGNCGTQTCINGQWGGCTGQGACSPGVVQACTGGAQTCTSLCTWGPCLGSCASGATGACTSGDTLSCGNCGTQPCVNGCWQSCSVPQGAVCAPGASRVCTGGTQTCTNSCAWGTCITCAATETSCTDGIDNDCNGLTDCADPTCSGTITGTAKELFSSKPITSGTINANSNSGSVKTANTNQQGAYNMQNVNCGIYSLVASAPNYIPVTKNNFNVPSRSTVTQDFYLPLGTSCESDCTFYFDNIVHKECDGINGCSFYDNTAKKVCDLAKPNWYRDYDDTHYVQCASGIPQLKVQIQTSISCTSGTIVKGVRVARLRGEGVRIVAVTCG